MLAKKFGELAFPQTDRDKREKLRAQIAAAARRLSSLIAEDGAPVPKKLAIRVEETGRRAARGDRELTYATTNLTAFTSR